MGNLTPLIMQGPGLVAMASGQPSPRAVSALAVGQHRVAEARHAVPSSILPPFQMIGLGVATGQSIERMMSAAK